jgi:hypothetical protein
LIAPQDFTFADVVPQEIGIAPIVSHEAPLG